jgi:hypothetical protein
MPNNEVRLLLRQPELLLNLNPLLVTIGCACELRAFLGSCSFHVRQFETGSRPA